MDTVFFVGVCLAQALEKYAKAHWVAQAVESTLKRTDWLKPSESTLKRTAASVFERLVQFQASRFCLRLWRGFFPGGVCDWRFGVGLNFRQVFGGTGEPFLLAW